MECVNTAIERLCDYLTQEKDENIKIIKDIAAGAVICFGFAFYISEGIMIGAHLIG
jgi:diacylglycerol kinase (ATP)